MTFLTPYQLRACLGPHLCPIFRPWCPAPFLALSFPSQSQTRRLQQLDPFYHLSLNTSPFSFVDTLADTYSQAQRLLSAFLLQDSLGVAWERDFLKVIW